MESNPVKEPVWSLGSLPTGRKGGPMKQRNKLYRAAVDLTKGSKTLRVTPPPMFFGGIGGVSIYNENLVELMAVPDPENAYFRTIRTHELIHAQRQGPPDPKQANNLAYQAIRDVQAHTRHWPQQATVGMHRDAACAGLIDLRHIKLAAQAGHLAEPEIWNNAIATAVRSVAITTHSGHPDRCKKSKTKSKYVVRERAKNLIGTLAPSLWDVLKDIVDTAQNDPQQAQEMLEALFKAKPGILPGCGWGGEPPENGIGAEGGGLDFDIIDLPRKVPTDPTRAHLYTAPSGGRFRAGRLTHCVVNGTSNGLFLRNKRLQGGAVLIDASGSMHPSNSLLSQICQKAPGAVVAYYDGNDALRGRLRIYAKDGMRFDGEGLPKEGGGNSVDLPALHWLLQQEGPRWFVTDRGFCGGCTGYPEATHVLFDQALMAGEVTHIESLAEALTLFLGMPDNGSR